MIETSLALFSLRKWFYEENYVKNQKVKRSLLCERGLGGVCLPSWDCLDGLVDVSLEGFPAPRARELVSGR